MPTKAEQDYQDNLMRQAVARAQIAQQGNAANAAAQAAMYQADRGVDATKYSADSNLSGVKDTNESRLAGVSMEQDGMTGRTRMQEAGANTRAETAIKPQMGALDFERGRYADTRADRYNDPDYIAKVGIAKEFADAMGVKVPGPSGGDDGRPAPSDAGARPAGSPSVTLPRAVGGMAAARVNGVQPMGTPTASPQNEQKPWDSTGFNEGVQQGASALYNVGLSDHYDPNEWKPGLSVRDKNGNRINIPPSVTAAPPRGRPTTTSDPRWLPAATPETVKQAMMDEATGKGAAAPTSQYPTHEAPGTVVASNPTATTGVKNDMRDQLLKGYMRKSFGEDADTVDARNLKNNVMSAKLDAIKNDPNLSPAEKASALDAVVKGGAIPASPGLSQAGIARDKQLTDVITPDLADITKFVRSNNWNFSDQDVSDWQNRVQSTVDRLRQMGGTPDMQKEATRRLIKATEDALKENGVLFESAGSDAFRAQLASMRKRYGL